MSKLLEILNSGLEDDELLDEFKEASGLLIVQLPLEHIIEEVMEDVFQLWHLKNKLESRI